MRIQQDSRQATSYFTMFENTTRLQATGGKLKLSKPTQFFFAMYQNTRRLQATRGTFQLLKPTVLLPIKILKPPMIWQCLKIHEDCREQGAFKLLKPPVIWPCVRIQQDSRQATNNCAMCEAQQDCRQLGKIEGIEATMCQNTTRFQASHQLVCNA